MGREIKFYKNNLYSDASIICKLEDEFAKYTGFKYGIAVNSCTSAIGLCLEYEKPVLVGIPAMTYVSVANEIIRHGCQLRLLDEYHVGHAYRLQGTGIWDSAHAVEKNPPHLQEDKYCYSFYPTKLVPSYEGGMICTDDQEFALWARNARQMGRTGYGAYYDVKYIGPKCNMTPIQARQALKSLKVLDQVKKHYDTLLEIYRQIPHINESYHLFVGHVDNGHDFRAKMLLKGIQCSWHFQPIYDKEAYKDYFKDTFIRTEQMKDKIVSFPLYPTLTRNQVNYILKCYEECK